MTHMTAYDRCSRPWFDVDSDPMACLNALYNNSKALLNHNSIFYLYFMWERELLISFFLKAACLLCSFSVAAAATLDKTRKKVERAGVSQEKKMAFQNHIPFICSMSCKK